METKIYKFGAYTSASHDKMKLENAAFERHTLRCQLKTGSRNRSRLLDYALMLTTICCCRSGLHTKT